MTFRGIQNQEQIFNKWSALINCKDDITSDVVKMSTAIVLENAQEKIDEQYRTKHGRGLLLEDAGISNAPTFGPDTAATSYANTARDGSGVGDARVPSIVIPMIRRIYPQLLAHKLVGVQPMQGPIGMAFAFRAKYGRFGRGPNSFGKEIGYLNVNPSFTGKAQFANKYNNKIYDAQSNGDAADDFGNDGDTNNPTDEFGEYPQIGPKSQDQGTVNLVQVSEQNIDILQSLMPKDEEGNPTVTLKVGQVINLAKPSATIDPQDTAPESETPADFLRCFLGNNGVSQYGGNTFSAFGDGADVSDAENWAVGRDMPEAGFEILKATVIAKTRKLGVQITRETEEDMKAMQGLNAQQEISELISYEIAQEIDRQLLGEIIQATIRAGNARMWDPAVADGRNQNERTNTLYTSILQASASIAVKSRRGAANWCVASPGAAALLESNIFNPLGVSGGLGNANAFGKSIDNNIGVVEIGALRNGTIKLYRDSLAGGEYVLLGFKGQQIYDAGIIYLPYIPLELNQALDPFTMNPITAARTRYGITTNLFGAGQFYAMIGLKNLSAPMDRTAGKIFIQ